MKEIVPECGLPRYSVRPLPTYRHLPFQNAHPFMDADGHSYGEKLNPPESFGPADWRHCDDYLYCVDLFNHAFWWEAHERFKPISIGAGRQSECGLFIQGLIQLAAGLLKYSLGEEGPAKTLVAMGLEHLAAVEKSYLGIDVLALCDAVAYFQERREKYPCLLLDLADGGDR